MIASEREAWQVIANTLEMLGEMPSDDDGTPCTHILRVIRLMEKDGVLPHSISVYLWFRWARAYGGGLPPLSWRTYARRARKLAQEARERGVS